MPEHRVESGKGCQCPHEAMIDLFIHIVVQEIPLCFHFSIPRNPHCSDIHLSIIFLPDLGLVSITILSSYYSRRLSRSAKFIEWYDARRRIRHRSGRKQESATVGQLGTLIVTGQRNFILPSNQSIYPASTTETKEGKQRRQVDNQQARSINPIPSYPNPVQLAQRPLFTGLHSPPGHSTYIQP